MFLKDEPAFGEPLNRVTGLRRGGMEVGGTADGGGVGVVIGESNRIPKHTEELLPLSQNQTD